MQILQFWSFRSFFFKK